MSEENPFEGMVKVMLSPEDISGRGLRLAEVLGKMESKKEKKELSAAINAELKALSEESRLLSMAIHEGFEWRDEATQEELGLGAGVAGGRRGKGKKGGKKK